MPWSIWQAKPIQQRLIGAYTHYLIPLRIEDFPEHRREDFAALKGLFREGPPGPLVMPDEEAEKWTRLIVSLFADLSQGRP